MKMNKFVYRISILIGMIIITNCTLRITNLCQSGLSQSPIDVTVVPTKVKDSSIKVLFDQVKGTLKWDNNLKTFAMHIPANQSNLFRTENFPIDAQNKINPNLKKTFYLNSVIFRIKSEHKFNGKDSPMEIQFLHTVDKADPKYNYNRLAFTIFVEPTEDEPDKLLSEILPDSEFNMNGLISAVNGVSYFSYYGALPHPPCTQDVNWFVFNKKLKISSAIYNAMKEIIKKKTGKELNNKATQPIKTRKVFQFGPIELTPK